MESAVKNIVVKLTSWQSPRHNFQVEHRSEALLLRVASAPSGLQVILRRGAFGARTSRASMSKTFGAVSERPKFTTTVVSIHSKMLGSRIRSVEE